MDGESIKFINNIFYRCSDVLLLQYRSRNKVVCCVHKITYFVVLIYVYMDIDYQGSTKTVPTPYNIDE